MSDTIDYGYKEEPQKEIGGIEEFEDIKVMLLERAFPSKYIQGINKENEEQANEATLLGIEYEAKKPSFKQGGVVWKYCVIQRAGKSSTINEKVLIPNDNGMFDEPSYVYCGQIQQLPPMQIFETKWDQGLGGDPHGAIQQGTRSPVISRFLPPTFQPYDFQNKRKFTDIPIEEDSAIAIELRQKEQVRRNNWNSVIEGYNKFNELDALKVLEMSLAYRYCLGNISEDGIFKYIRPHKGMTFNIRRGPINSKYLDIQPFVYDKDIKKYIHFVSEVTAATPDTEYVADLIIATRAAAVAKRSQNKPKAQVAGLDEETTF